MTSLNRKKVPVPVLVPVWAAATSITNRESWDAGYMPAPQNRCCNLNLRISLAASTQRRLFYYQ
ncbi:hypothetical protein [Microcoleus sp. FACHB-672]|uniref:hypothetical protein n=1 Tax=Microcoleus sp. FACHB-672 TaxID=2692825 RepID=UPI0016895E4C|nr:hypothetical protein [Microcoleus sp. FACHB-672]